MIHEIQNSNIDSNNIGYQILNKDIEILDQYFDIVPDGNIFAKNGSPIFAIRMKPMGINIVLNYYYKKYGINIDQICYKSSGNEHTIHGEIVEQIFSSDSIKKYFNFDSLESNSAKGLIISIVNRDSRLMHSIYTIYGKNKDGKKFAIALDPYFTWLGEIDVTCLSTIEVKFFKDNFSDIDVYCHNQRIQADHHSCGIMACDIIKDCLIKNSSIAKSMIKNSLEQKKFTRNNQEYIFNEITLHPEILKLSQISKFYESISDDTDVSKYKRPFSEYINQNKVKIKYYKEPAPYNPENNVFPNDIKENIVDKKINARLLLKGHQYAKLILRLTNYNGLNGKYDPNYWIKVIKSHGENGDFSGKQFVSIIRDLRKEIKNWTN